MAGANSSSARAAGADGARRGGSATGKKPINGKRAAASAKSTASAGSSGGRKTTATPEQAAVRLGKSAVSIRLAKSMDDVRAMMDLGRVLHAESRFKSLPLSDGHMEKIGIQGLANGNPGLIMAERDGELVGMAIVVLGEYYFAEINTATVQLLYVRPDARGGAAAIKLLRALRKWAAEAGSNDLHVNVTTGIAAAKTDRFLRRMGFKQTGGNYVLEGV